MGEVATISQTGDCEVTIGTSSQCDIALTDPYYSTYLSENHAAVRRKGKTYYVKDTNSKQGTFVNGRKVGKSWTRISLHDDIYLGQCPFKVAGLLLRDQRVTLEAYNLNYSIESSESGLMGKKQPRVLTDGVSFRAEPGELIAIMGPSGAGKTVLLNLLNGAHSPTKDGKGNQGAVVVNGRFSVHEDQDLLRDFIGYVPQDDMLIPELTVRQSLDYSLDLKYADSGITQEFKAGRINSTAQKLGFTDEKTAQYLDTQIGSVDTSRGLSGGERKKANIAHELIKNPLLLFLDEPTSGLSSVDSDTIIGLLKKLCKKDLTTTLMTVHQPSEASFNLLDKILLLNYGGTVAFYGSPEDAVSYFEAKRGTRIGQRNPAEFILESLDQWTREETPAEAYRHTSHYQAYSPKGSWIKPAGSNQAERSHTIKGFIRQFNTLFRRHLCVNRADKSNLWFQFAQPVLIASLMLFCFYGYQADYSKQNQDERTTYYQVKQSQASGLVMTRQNLDEATEWAKAPENQKFLGVGAANRIGAIYFLMIVSAIWVGIINTCREIVGEKAVLKREGRSYLRMSSYLGSKFIYFSMLSALQVAVIVVPLKIFLMPEMPAFFMWGLLSLTSACAAGIGLTLSAIVNTQRTALTAVPLVLIPQLLFGGLVRPIKFLQAESSLMIDGFHHMMLQKWAFLAALLGEDKKGCVVLEKVADFTHYDATKRLTYECESLTNTFFGTLSTPLDSALISAFIAIAAQCLTLLLVAYCVIRMKYQN